MTLEEEGISASSVADPAQDSPMEEVDCVLAVLRLKCEGSRHALLARDVILGLSALAQLTPGEGCICRTTQYR